MDSLFDATTGVESDFIEAARPYLQDIRPIRNRLLEPVTNPEQFSQEVLQEHPDYSWLNEVSINMVTPVSDHPEQQRAQLTTFASTLRSAATTSLSHAQFPKLYPAEFSEPVIVIDTETTGLDLRTKYDYSGRIDPQTVLVGLALAVSNTHGFYLPIRHTGKDGIRNWSPEAIIPFIDRLHQEYVVVYHNAKYDREVLALNGVAGFRDWPYFLDTQILDYLRDVNNKLHGLKFISNNYLNRKMVEIHELFLGLGVPAKDAKDTVIRFDSLPATTALVYATSDALNTFGAMLLMQQSPEPFNPFTSQTLPCEIDHKMSDALRCMIRPGMPIQYEYFYFAALDCYLRLAELEKKIIEFVGHDFDLNSPDQVSKVLFDEMGVPPLPNAKRGKKGQFSTDANQLEQLLEQNPDFLILRWVVVYRSMQSNWKKIYLKAIANTYTDAYLPWMRVRLDFNLTNVPTGRLSSSSDQSRERIIRKETKTATSFKYDSGVWTCGFNSQGVPSDPYYTARSRRLTSVPEGVTIGGEVPQLDRLYSDRVKLTVLRELTKI